MHRKWTPQRLMRKLDEVGANFVYLINRMCFEFINSALWIFSSCLFTHLSDAVVD